MEDLATKMDAEVRVHEVVKDYQGVPQGDVTLVKLPNLKEGRCRQTFCCLGRSWGFIKMKLISRKKFGIWQLEQQLYWKLDRELYRELYRELDRELYRELHGKLYEQLERKMKKDL